MANINQYNQHVDWEKLWTFHMVAETGSFTRASERLALSQPTISRRVAALEDQLGCRLFRRHATGLSLTEQGETLHHEARDILARLNHVSEMLHEAREQPSGLLRITTTKGFGSLWLAPKLLEFRTSHPNITLDLVLEDEDLDLQLGAAHVAIRMHPSRQLGLIQRPVLSSSSHIYASAAYLDSHGHPQSCQELSQHVLLAYGQTRPAPSPVPNWILSVGLGPDEPPREPVLTANNSVALLHAAQAGLGCAAFPDYLAALCPTLIPVLPELAGPSTRGYFVYAEEMRHSFRVRALRDFLLARLPKFSL